MPQAKKKQTYEQYDIELDGMKPYRCPRCDQYQLEVNEQKESWYCTGCSWRGRLKEMDREGVMDIDTAAPALERWHAVGPPQGMSYGWPSFDRHAKAVRGEWTLLVGYPSHGKSHLMYAAAVNMAWQGWRFAIFGPENIPYERQVKGLMQKFMGKRLSNFDNDEMGLAKIWLREHFWFVEPVEMTFEALLAQFRKVIREKKIQGAIIDPWNEIEHEVPKGMTETQYVAKCLIRLRRFAEAMHVHLWVVAHPSKISVRRNPGEDAGKRPVVMLSDTSGSSHFENKCYFGISVWRNPMAEGDDKHVNKIYVLKARNEDAGRVGMFKLHWDPKSTNYRDDEQQVLPEPHGEEYKRILAARFGDWKEMVRRQTKHYQESIKRRLLEWRLAGKGEPLTAVYFDNGSESGSVLPVLDPQGRVDAWIAKVIRKDRTVEGEFPDKEDAMDWCEKAAMSGPSHERAEP